MKTIQVTACNKKTGENSEFSQLVKGWNPNLNIKITNTTNIIGKPQISSFDSKITISSRNEGLKKIVY